VPTDYEQSTGIERYQLLGNMAGIDVFDQKPIQMDRMGTMQDPITVNGVIDNRIIGCSGYPMDSHDLQWFTYVSSR
ncbi:cytochrome c oxidase, partial [Mrakia frigida]|uniref:cytochrome c oxidase subunit IV n=1 Tax=Mrakia frigida TaxID=29902 RepID=UPI003FCBF5B6